MRLDRAAVLAGVLQLVPVGIGVASFLGDLFEQLGGQRQIPLRLGTLNHPLERAKPDGPMRYADQACVFEERLAGFGEYLAILLAQPLTGPFVRVVKLALLGRHHDTKFGLDLFRNLRWRIKTGKRLNDTQFDVFGKGGHLCFFQCAINLSRA